MSFPEFKYWIVYSCSILSLFYITKERMYFCASVFILVKSLAGIVNLYIITPSTRFSFSPEFISTIYVFEILGKSISLFFSWHSPPCFFLQLKNLTSTFLSASVTIIISNWDCLKLGPVASTNSIKYWLYFLGGNYTYLLRPITKLEITGFS